LSNAWLQGFQRRFNIKEFINHGEAASAEIDKPDTIAQMEKVRLLVVKYDPDDVLNMDETGLFWKLTPDRTVFSIVQTVRIRKKIWAYRIYWHIRPPYVARARQMPSLRGGTIQKGVLYASCIGHT